MQAGNINSLNTIDQIFERVFRTLKPRTVVPNISIRFRKYANANSRIRLEKDQLSADISDLFENAPIEVQEALAYILLAKLYRKEIEPTVIESYRKYLNRSDVRHTIHNAKRQRGRKNLRGPEGHYFDLVVLFDELNNEYFKGLMQRPLLGWSRRSSRTTLGHYDPAHHVIVLSSLLDSADAPGLVVRYVMFHEMLHLEFPTEHRESRRCVHTRAFKEAERLFREYEEAQAQLRKFMQESYRRAKYGD